MPKNRKTRKQKLKADQRKKVAPSIQEVVHTSPTELHTFTYTPVTITSPASSSAIEVTSYHYLVKDLRKTLLLTVIIIIMEFVLSYLVR